MRVGAALSPRRRVARSTLGVLVLTLVTGLGPTVPAAFGESGPLDFACTATGDPSSVTVTMDGDTEAALPTLMRIGSSVPATVVSALPGGIAADAVGQGADRFSGVVHYRVEEPEPRTLDLAIPVTDLGDQATPVDVPFTATGSYTAVHAGEHWLYVTGATIDLDYLGAGGTASHLTLDCAITTHGYLDIIRVYATSTTTLSLSASPTASYGQPVTATARVELDDWTPDGHVYFDVDGVLHGVVIHDAPRVAFAIPPLAIGVHQVTASYIPWNERFQTRSETTPQTLTVVGAATRTLVHVTGRRPHRQTRAFVQVRAAFQSVPTGRVRLELRERGTTRRSVVRSTLDTGSAIGRLGQLDRGRYRLVVTYRGDGNHERSRTTVTFRVRG